MPWNENNRKSKLKGCNLIPEYKINPVEMEKSVTSGRGLKYTKEGGGEEEITWWLCETRAAFLKHNLSRKPQDERRQRKLQVFRQEDLDCSPSSCPFPRTLAASRSPAWNNLFSMDLLYKYYISSHLLCLMCQLVSKAGKETHTKKPWAVFGK